MMKNIRRNALYAVAFSSALVWPLIGCAEAETPEEIIAERLQEARPDMSFGEVRPSPIDGLYQVQVSGGPVLYITPDGGQFVVGDLFEVRSDGFAPKEDPYQVEKRQSFIDGLEAKDYIDFPAKDETRAVVYAFTDVDCGFCRRLHSQIDGYTDDGQEMPGYSDLGIEIRYLAYPRAGVDSPSGEKLITAWCSEDRQTVMDKLKNRRRVEPASCDDHPVAEQMRTGSELGVNGTPALLLPDGRLLAGYLPPQQLAAELGL